MDAYVLNREENYFKINPFSIRRLRENLSVNILDITAILDVSTTAYSIAEKEPKAYLYVTWEKLGDLATLLNTEEGLLISYA